jgi:oxaloacetate decarboxylase gamma subunit
MAGDPLFEQGLSLMLYGMGIVAVFLTVLVILTVLMSKLLTRWFPETDKTAALVNHDDGDIEPQIVAIIQAAIDKHRARR